MSERAGRSNGTLMWAMSEGLFMPKGCPFMIKLTPQESARLEERAPGHTLLYGHAIPAHVIADDAPEPSPLRRLLAAFARQRP